MCRLATKIVFALSLFVCVSFATRADSPREWRELSSDHFRIYFTSNEDFAKEVASNAEHYYRKIAVDLGYPRYSEFWTWEKRVKIYIYPDHPVFLKATNQPQWSQGMADYKKKEIISYTWGTGFVESLLPHEMAHLIFRDFVGFKGQIPVWLDEGVAQWAEEIKRQHIKSLVRNLYDKDSLLSLADMMRLDIREIRELDKVYMRATRTKDGESGVLFISGDNLINTYYLQSVSLVGFLIERYGSESFAEFCRQLRDGKTFDEALRFSYPVHLRNLDDLESKWREYIAKGE